ncbi:NifB/NifX family molybdenum-iron cluster-binding protein, partial [Candidatus Bathyarchaeota archaeon]|nr:NifB/NifX family molybdenum-iron cluster-binding protein [Candidatus Bathyarchaeota archaeon]
PEFIASQGAKVIIAGEMGPRAIDWFNRLGVQPITGVSGVIRDVLNDYLAGKLADAKPCDEYEEGIRRGGTMVSTGQIRLQIFYFTFCNKKHRYSF